MTGGPQDVVIETGIPPEKVPVRRPLPAAISPAPPVGERKDAHPESRIPRGAVERLRDLGRPVGQRTSTSLRHTGLMRPVSMEVIPGYLDNPVRDSAKTTPLVEAKGGDAGRDGFKAGN
jgi:flagellar protein FliO/FliZ